MAPTEFRRPAPPPAAVIVAPPVAAPSPPAAPQIDLDRLSREMFRRLDARLRLEADRRGGL